MYCSGESNLFTETLLHSPTSGHKLQSVPLSMVIFCISYCQHILCSGTNQQWIDPTNTYCLIYTDIEKLVKTSVSQKYSLEHLMWINLLKLSITNALLTPVQVMFANNCSCFRKLHSLFKKWKYQHPVF